MNATQTELPPTTPPPGDTPTNDVKFFGQGEAVAKIPVDISVLPEKRYKNCQIDGEVTGIASIGDIPVVISKKDGYSRVVAFDQATKRLDILLDPTFGDLRRHMQRKYISTTPSGVYERAGEIAVRAGYPPSVAGEIQRKFKSISDNKFLPNASGDVFEDSLEQNKTTLLTSGGTWGVVVGQRQENHPEFVFYIDESQFILSPDKIRSNSIDMLPTMTFERPKNPGDRSTILCNEFSNNLQLQTSNNLIEIRSGTRIAATFSGTSVIRDPTTPDTIYFINTGKIYSLDVSMAVERKAGPIQQTQFKVKVPEELAIDPNGNYLIIRGGTDVTVVDKRSGEQVHKIADIQGYIHVNDQGDILFIDTKNNLREAQTNFKAIPAGGTETSLVERENQLRQMEQRFSNLKLDSTSLSPDAPTTEARVEKTLRQKMGELIKEKLGDAPTEEIYDDLLDRLSQLRDDPVNKGYEQVFDEFAGDIKGKLTVIRVGRLTQGLGEFDKQMAGVKSVGDSIALEDRYLELVELRQKIDIGDMKMRHEVEAQMKAVEFKKNGIVTQYQGELVHAIRTELPNLKTLLDEAGSTEELATFNLTPESRQVDLMIANVKDTEERRALREEVRGMKTTRQHAVESSQRTAELDKNIRYAEILEEVHTDMSALSDEISKLTDPKAIERFRRNPAVTTIKGRLLMLPSDLRAGEQEKLEMLFNSRRLDIKHITDLGVQVTGETVKLGSIEFQRYHEQRLVFAPRLEPVPGNNRNAHLKFIDQNGRIYKTQGGEIIIPNDLSDAKTVAAVERFRTAADEFYRGIKRKVPDFDPYWRITPYIEDKMGEMGETIQMQLAYHRGILILQGEAGTGKNVLADMFGNLTNREIVTISCNENTTKEDMQFEFQYDPKKGTYKLPSKLIEGIQTPGAIIILDEINSLKPGIAKLLNPLFDYRRRIYISEGGSIREIIAEPSVIFLGTMNPQNYAGVHRLSQEVKSRARIMDVPYPPFEEERNGGGIYYRPDESYMLGAHIDGLGDLNRDEFTGVWDAVINKSHGAASSTAQALMSATPEFETHMRQLYDVVRVSDRLRKMYEAYQTGESTEPMDFPVSLREGQDIVMELGYRKDVFDSVTRVILPKIDDRRQRKLIEASIKAELVKP